METKRKTSSTEFEKHPNPEIEAGREAVRQQFGYNPPMPHVTLLPRKYWGGATEREKPETTADFSK
jgi:hypothetical protein